MTFKSFNELNCLRSPESVPTESMTKPSNNRRPTVASRAVSTITPTMTDAAKAIFLALFNFGPVVSVLLMCRDPDSNWGRLALQASALPLSYPGRRESPLRGDSLSLPISDPIFNRIDSYFL